MSGSVVVWDLVDARETRTPPFDHLSITEFHEIAIAPDDLNRVSVKSKLFSLFIWETTGWVQREARHGLEADSFDAVPTRLVAFDPIDPCVVYAGNWLAFRGYSNGIFRSTDGGDIWVNITHNSVRSSFPERCR